MKKIFNIILIVIPLIIILVLLVLVLERNKKVTLPAPTGDFAVGRTTYEWTDTTRIDSLAPEPDTRRELFIWAWYPVTKTNDNSTSEYLPEEWRKAITKRQGIFSRLITRKLSKINSHSIEGAELSSQNTRYPVVLIKSGIGTMISDYTTIAEYLASHGYIVIGCDSPYSNNVVVFSDGRIINDNTKGNPSNVASSVDRNRRLDRLVTIWSEDIHFILDKLEHLNDHESTDPFFRRLNLKQVGVFGHSLGGAAAFRFCFNDPRCKAGVSINGIPFGNISQDSLSKPFMFLLADQSGEHDAVSLQFKKNIDSIYNQLPESRVLITLQGAEHLNFSDQALIREHFIARRSGEIGSIDKKHGLEVTAACLQTFLDINLKGLKTAQINDLQGQYPEIMLKK